MKKVVETARRLGKPRPRVLVTGHSLGGAIAVLFAHLMAEGDVAPDEVSVFGAPRVSFKGFRELYGGHRIPTRHTLTRDDPVTVMPPFYEEPLPADHYELPVDDGVDLFRRHDPSRYRAALSELCEKEYDFRARRLYEAFEKNLGRGATKQEMIKLVPATFERGLDPVLQEIAKPGFRP